MVVHVKVVAQWEKEQHTNEYLNVNACKSSFYANTFCMALVTVYIYFSLGYISMQIK